MPRCLEDDIIQLFRMIISFRSIRQEKIYENPFGAGNTGRAKIRKVGYREIAKVRVAGTVSAGAEAVFII